MIWWIMLGAGIANFLSRFLMFSGFRGTRLPAAIEPYLAYVPTAVMSAIIAASLLEDWQIDARMLEIKLMTSFLALGVAIVFRSVLSTIIVGLVFFQLLLGLTG